MKSMLPQDFPTKMNEAFMIPVFYYQFYFVKDYDEKGLKEDCIQQIYFLFSGLFGGKEGLIRGSKEYLASKLIWKIYVH